MKWRRGRQAKAPQYLLVVNVFWGEKFIICRDGPVKIKVHGRDRNTKDYITTCVVFVVKYIYMQQL